MTTLMVAANLKQSESEGDEATYCLGVRFCTADRVKHTEDLLVKQIRKRYTRFRGMKPKKIRAELMFNVYEVSLRNAGWPKWLGPAGYYH